MDTERRGQALVELAAGMFTLALVVSALCAFAVYIAKSLKAENALRAHGGLSSTVTEKVDVGAFAAENFTGSSSLDIREHVVLPARTIVR